MDGMYRELSNQEVKEFKQWANENYKPNEPIESLWHPVIKQECERINIKFYMENTLNLLTNQN